MWASLMHVFKAAQAENAYFGRTVKGHQSEGRSAFPKESLPLETKSRCDLRWKGMQSCPNTRTDFVSGCVKMAVCGPHSISSSDDSCGKHPCCLHQPEVFLPGSETPTIMQCGGYSVDLIKVVKGKKDQPSSSLSIGS